MSSLDDASLTAFVDHYQLMVKRQDLEDVATKKYLLPVFENLAGFEEEVGTMELTVKKSTLAQNWQNLLQSSHPYQSDAQLGLALSQMPFDTDESITFAEFAQLYKCIIATMQMLSICPSKEGRERLRGRVGVLLVTVENTSDVGGWQDLLKPPNTNSTSESSQTATDDSISFDAPTVTDTLTSDDGETIAVILGEKDRQTEVLVRGYKSKLLLLSLSLLAFVSLALYNLTVGFSVTYNHSCPSPPPPTQTCRHWIEKTETLSSDLSFALKYPKYFANYDNPPPQPRKPLTLPFTRKKINLPSLLTRRVILEAGLVVATIFVAPYLEPIKKIGKGVQIGLGVVRK
ncbi:hypothetical protein TrVE_jg4056 [Triparma verrucosa]|uniref:Uncharacterized protein n=1 Tax=Triparma verrucosa TaxID=1606542 RepID=A0A9W7ERE6_9STRA|nr:hypothetical protein TrVE_jg4056 [Triparma verrucosa]